MILKYLDPRVVEVFAVQATWEGKTAEFISDYDYETILCLLNM